MVFSSREMQKRLMQNKAYDKFFCLKRSVSQTFESSSCKKVYPKFVYHWYNLLRWIFFILRDNWKQYFLHKFIVPQRLGATAMLLRSLKQLFWKKSGFYMVISTIILRWCYYQRFKIKLLFFKFSPKKIFADSFFYTLSFCKYSLFFF